MLSPSSHRTKADHPSYTIPHFHHQGEGFEATLAAAEDAERSTTRTIKDVEEKVWEEVLKVDPVVAAKKAKKLNKKSAAAARRESMAMETTPAIGTAA